MKHALGLLLLLSYFLMTVQKGALFGQSLNTTQIQFRSLDINDGLSQNSVVSITQDSMGFLWFATQDGLNRYHGDFKYFEEYYEDYTRPQNFSLGKLYVDREGQLWSIPKNGKLHRYLPEIEKFVIEDSTEVEGIFQDSYERYWLIKPNGLIEIITEGKNEMEKQVIDLNVDHIYEIVQISEGQMDVATNRGIHRYSILNEKIEKFQIYHSDISFSCITGSLKSGVLYGSFENGVYQQKIGAHEIVPKSTENLNPVIYDIHRDNKDRIWLGTYGSGLYVLNVDGSIDHFMPSTTSPASISYHDILNIYEDNTGVIWLGTDGGGLSFYDEYLNKFNVFRTGDLGADINIDVIRSIYADDKHLLLGTSGKGLAYLDKQTQEWRQLTNSNGLTSNRILALAKDSLGYVWIGTQFGGLQIFELKDAFRLNKVDISEYTISSFLYEKAKDRMWIGTAEGVLILFENRNLSKIYSIPKSYTVDASIRCLSFDVDGNILLGTDNDGLFLFNQIEEKITSVDDQLKEIIKVKCIQLYNEDIFIGTDGSGMFRYNKKRKTLDTLANLNLGLANNVVYGIHSGDEKDLWVSTNRGISRISIGGEINDIHNYKLSDGLQSLEFNTGAHFKAQDGLIYFGGIKGINFFDPLKIPLNKQAPKALILKIRNDEQSMSQSKQPIKIPFQKNSFTLEFAASQLSYPQGNRYKYRLLGFEDNWIETLDKKINYMNIPPGHYEFQLMARHYDGQWSSRPESQRIVIEQIWFRTKLAYLIYTLGIIWALWAYRNYRKRKWKLEAELKMEHEEAERLKELNNIKNKIYTNVTHEFLTPLTVIKGLNSKIEGFNSYTEKIDKSTSVLLDLVNQILALAKMDSGQLKYEPFQIDIVMFLKYLTESYVPFANEKNIAIKFHSDLQALRMDVDKEKFKVLVGNLIANAIKYTPESGMVKVALIQNNINSINVVVSDNGFGMNAEVQKKIFDRFYQSDDISAGGAGIGLAIVKDFSTLMGGTISVSSTVGKGSAFKLNLKITNDAPFLDEENDTQTNSIPQANNLENSKIQIGQVESMTHTILLIEDNTDIAFYIKKVLESKYQILHALNGKEGLSMAKNIIPDLIITDIMMPYMDGLEMSDQIKKSIETSHIPIIILTSKRKNSDKIMGLKIGADAFLTKPFVEEELIVRVEAMIENRKSLQSYYQQHRTLKAYKSTDQKFISRIEELIAKNLSNEDFAIQDLCRAVNLERTQVYRKVKAITGFSPSKLIRLKRIDRAKQMLVEGVDNISEIAYECGFANVSYFSKTFKTATGSSPSQFIKGKS